MASQIPVLGILTLAMALPMLTGGINLSIIAGMNACSLIIAYFITQYTGISWLFIAILLSLCCALAIGLLNGTLIAIIRVSPILATLGTMTLINGINILVTNGSTIANFPETMLSINASAFLWIPLPILIFLFLAGLIWFFLEKLQWVKRFISSAIMKKPPIIRVLIPKSADLGLCYLLNSLCICSYFDDV